MNQWDEHVSQLKGLLEELKQNLVPYWDKKLFNEKNSQLKSLEKIITQLQKTNTPIPDELRHLKFKLLKELDAFFEAEAIKAETLSLFAPFMSKAVYKRQPKIKIFSNQSTNSKKSDSRITLKELIDANILPVPLKLSKKYKGKFFQANIIHDGHIELTLNGVTQHYDSPSAAAVAATSKPQNGWVWWNIDGEPDNINLDFYRRKIIR